MEVGSPEWIEASLARLDELERERAEHEAALETVEDPTALKRHTEAFTRLEAARAPAIHGGCGYSARE